MLICWWKGKTIYTLSVRCANSIRLPKHCSKAFIHTWLAWQKDPGLPMGRAITAKALSADSAIAVSFVNWLNRLFNL
jgi:hypothetical protein